MNNKPLYKDTPAELPAGVSVDLQKAVLTAPSGWEAFFKEHFYDPDTKTFASPARAKLAASILLAYEEQAAFPPADCLYGAFRYCAFDKVRVVLLGQDPYHESGQAHGLSFSVPQGVRLPPSLRNIFQERASDLGIPPSGNGDLSAWAKQGVLLLNSTLTVAPGKAGSHRAFGWQDFTDAVICAVDATDAPVAFILWGRDARAKTRLLRRKADGSFYHRVIESEHPSPLSAYRGFFGSKPFSAVNAYLSANGLPPIDWNN